ncbi:NAD(P)-binding domain-containing protein [Allokutzneria sp. A3M-2-11 16]|uniref:NAD(P)-dependent oxidoreductase n=1 Tax=Allokutzneria sp. A3M-2-11 16 TaxID=2962043 RepID=UPI0020B88A77|nr:NAD(P)-binding domain-containing protein [Allokutzneria sp. A3M-2-11 16]MCP3805528.1 NAD(P)-binding domain-containing protein [Allokutzneria sp. A3M-2-11 16]
MTDTPAPRTGSTLLGLGAMGTALASAWLTAGHDLTVWNRTAARARPFAERGATVAASAAEAVAANDLVVVCLLDDASVRATLDGVDLTGKDLVNLTTGTPGSGRALAEWATARGARFVDGGIMAVPPMIGVPGSGAYVFYSGSAAAFEAHHGTLAVPAGTKYVGEDPGFAALYDVALLSAMTGMFAGVSHAFALVRKENIDPRELAGLLSGWLTAMSGYANGIAGHLVTGDYTTGVTSNLAMMAEGNATMLRTAQEQGVSPELLQPFMRLMQQLVDDGHGDEDTTGVVDLLLSHGTGPGR